LSLQRQYQGDPRLHYGLVLGLIAASLILFYAASRPREPAFVSDSNFYLAGAESLAETGQYRLITHQGAPWIGLYPPLQSAYLSLYWRLEPSFPANLGLLQSGMVLLVVMACLALFAIQCHFGVTVLFAALLSLALGLSPTLYVLAYSFFSDVLFAGLAFGLILDWLYLPAGKGRWAASGLLLGLMYLTRTAALGIAAPMLCFAGWAAVRSRTGWPLVLTVAPVGMAIYIWNFAMPHGTPTYITLLVDAYHQHAGWFQNGWPSFARYVRDQSVDFLSGRDLLRTIFPSFEPIFSSSLPGWLLKGLTWIAGALFLFSAAIGYVRDSWKEKHAALAVLLCYSIELILWPWRLEPRTLIPLLPLAIVWSAKGWNAFRDRGNRLARMGSLAGLGTLLLFNCFVTLEQSKWLSAFGALPELRDIAERIGKEIPAGHTIAAGTDLPLFQFYHYSGGRCVPFVKYGPVKASQTNQAEYLLLWQPSSSFSSHLRPIFRSSGLNYQLSRAVSSPIQPALPNNLDQLR
jgi:hypothetical protein